MISRRAKKRRLLLFLGQAVPGAAHLPALGLSDSTITISHGGSGKTIVPEDGGVQNSLPNKTFRPFVTFPPLVALEIDVYGRPDRAEPEDAQ